MENNFQRWNAPVSIQRIVLLLLLMLATATVHAAAEVPSSSTTGLLFDFSPPISDGAWQAIITALVRNDLSKLFGRTVLLVQRRRVPKGTEFFDVVQVALRGDCAAGRDISSAAEKGPLGWVYLVNGRIEQFVFVDCDQIAGMLQRELREKAISERQRVMAWAISHVIVHELTHIVTQNPGHQLAGPLKAHATKADLLSDVPEHRTDGASTLVGCPSNKWTGTSSLEGNASVDAVCWRGAQCIAPPC